jgi:hypothetical protein
VAERGLPALSLDLGQRRGFVSKETKRKVFAVSSPFLGVLLGILALAIFVREKSNRGLRGLNGSERNLRFIRGIRVISGSTILQIFVKCPSSNA